MTKICDTDVTRKRIRLSDAMVAALRPKDSTYICWDRDARAFGVRVTPNGARSYVCAYTNRAGARRRMTLGAAEEMDVATARAKASSVRVEVKSGHDPLEARNKERRALAQAPTVADLCKDWIENHAAVHKRQSSQRFDRDAIKKYLLPQLGNDTKVAAVTWSHVENLHRKIVKDGHPVMANRVVVLLAAMFNRAIKKQWATENPARGIELVREVPRERYLSLDEMSRLQAALAESPHRDSVRAILLLVATGSRKSEVLGACWSEFDLTGNIWTRASHRTKQKTTSTIPLNALALRILRDMEAERTGDAPYLFPANDADGPQRDIKRFWGTIRRKAGIADVRIHDLRHSFASFLVARGVPLLTIGQLLGHTQSRTTQRYAHLDLSALRHASEVMSGVLTVEPPVPPPSAPDPPTTPTDSSPERLRGEPVTV